MADITTRAGKGSPLTNNEVDANFTNLNTDKAENGANSDITSMSGITGGIASPDYIDFDTLASSARNKGRVRWNDTDGTLEVDMNDSEVTMQIGQEILGKVYNNSGETILNGEVVYVDGSANGNLSVKKYIADGSINSILVFGLASEDIPSEEYGYATRSGLVRDLDTTGYDVGDILYASTAVAGGLQEALPVTPLPRTAVALVVNVSATEGRVVVDPITSPNSEAIEYNNADSQLSASNVKAAIDELDLNKADVSLLSSNATFFATDASSPISGYSRIVTSVSDSDYDDTPVDISTGDLSPTESSIAKLASDEGVFDGDVAGISITTVGNVRRVSGNDAGQFKFKIYKRDSGGTETLIGESGFTDNVDVEEYVQFFESAYIGAGATFGETDRVVIEFIGKTKSGSAGTSEFEFQFGGDTPIRSLFPVGVTVVPTDKSAAGIIPDTTNFSNVLSGSDTTLQAALDTIDDHGHGISDISGLQSALDGKATTAQGDLADTAIQPSDNVSELTNDSGYISANQTITLSGDVVGSGTTSIEVAIVDDSHNHIIANVDGLQDALDDKLNITSYTAADVIAKVKTVDGAGSGLDADTLDGSHASAFATAAQGALADSSVQPLDNVSGLTNDAGYISGNQTITLSGDVSGTGTTSISVTVADNSHNHIAANITDLGTNVKTFIGEMVTGNTENGIAVTYQSSDQTLDFDVEDFSITLNGDVTGSATITNLGDATISTSLSATYDNYQSWTVSDGTNSEAIASGDTLSIVGSGATSASYNSSTNTLTISSTDTDTNTTYSAGSGLDLAGTVFSVEPDLRDGITHVGPDTGDYITWTVNSHTSFVVDGGERVRIESDGDIHADGDVIAFSTTISDERLKTNIQDIPDALTKIEEIRGVTFTRHNGSESAGVVAQEVERILPQAVKEKALPLITGSDEETYKVVEYDALVGLLVQAVKDLSAEVKELKSKIEG